MDAITSYKIIHITGIALLAIGTGGRLAGGERRKSFAVAQGLGLLVMLVSGFGLLARLHLGYPPFAIVKTVLWVLIAMLPVLFRKLKTPLAAEILIVLILVGVMTYLGLMKPALW
ncbi:MAG: hypothetical protein ABI318_14710 [Chthoniobacteraceae bacterium]